MPNINVVYWNIEKFGKYNSDNANRCNVIAQAAKSAEADIICMMELDEHNIAYLDTLQQALNTAFSQTLLGGTVIQSGNWYYDWIRASTHSSPYDTLARLWNYPPYSEGYAVFWNQNIAKFTMEPAAPVPTFDAGGSANGRNPNTQSYGLQVLTTNGGINYSKATADINIPPNPGQYTLPAGTVIPNGQNINGTTGTVNPATPVNAGTTIPAGTFIGAAGMTITIPANSGLGTGITTVVAIPGGYTLVNNFTLPAPGEPAIPHHALNLVLDGRAVTDAANHQATAFDPLNPDAGWKKLEFTDSSGNVQFDHTRRPTFCTINPVGRPVAPVTTPIEDWLLPITLYHAPADDDGALRGTWRASLARSLYVVYDRASSQWKAAGRVLAGGDYNLRFHDDRADPSHLPALVSTTTNQAVLEAYTKTIALGGNGTTPLVVADDTNRPGIHKSNLFATAFSATKSTDLRKHQLDNLFHRGMNVSPPFTYGPNDEINYGYLYDMILAVLPTNTGYLNKTNYPSSATTAWSQNFEGIPPATLANFPSPTGLMTGIRLFNSVPNAAQFIRDHISDHLPPVFPVLDAGALPQPDVSKTEFTVADARLQYDDSTPLPLTTQVTLALKDKTGTIINRPVRSLRLEITNGSFTHPGATRNRLLAQQGNQSYTVNIYSPTAAGNATITVKAYLESRPIKTLPILFLEKKVHFGNSLIKTGTITDESETTKKIPLQLFLRDDHGNVVYSNNETFSFRILGDKSNADSSFARDNTTTKTKNATYVAAGAGQDAFYGVDLFVPAADPRALIQISDNPITSQKFAYIGTPDTTLSTAAGNISTNRILVGATNAYIHITLKKGTTELGILGNNHPPVIGQSTRLTITSTLHTVAFGTIEEIEDGLYRAKITVPTVPTSANFTITASWDGTVIRAISGVAIIVAPVDAERSALEITDRAAGDDNVYPMTAGTTATLQLTARDLYNNPITGKADSRFALSLPNGMTKTTIREPDASEDPGIYTCTLKAANDTIGDEKIVWETLDNNQAALQIAIRLTPDQAHAGSSSLAVDKEETLQGGAVNVTVQIKDQHGNPTGTDDQPVTLTFDQPNHITVKQNETEVPQQSGAYPLTAVPDSPGEYHAQFIYDGANDVQVTPKLGDDNMPNKTVTFVAKAAEANTGLTINGIPATASRMTLDVLTDTAVQIALSDAAGQPVNAGYYNVIVKHGMDGQFPAYTQLTASGVIGEENRLNGTLQFPTTGRAALEVTIHSADNGETFNKKVKFNIRPRPAVAANSSIAIPAISVKASNKVYYTLATIEFRDVANNLTTILTNIAINYTYTGTATSDEAKKKLDIQVKKPTNQEPDKGKLELLISSVSSRAADASIDVQIGGISIQHSPQTIHFFDSDHEQAMATNSQMVVIAHGSSQSYNGNPITLNGYQQIERVVAGITLRNAADAPVMGTGKVITVTITKRDDGATQTVDATYNPQTLQYEADIFPTIDRYTTYDITATWDGNAIGTPTHTVEVITNDIRRL